SPPTQPTFLFGLLCWVVCCFLTLTVEDAVHKLQVSLLALVLVSAAGAVWLRRDQQVLAR
ncbi:MAG TPA: hypothetical protein D7H92_00385, partial [Candidatus Poseidoniales archaeon]